MQICQEKELASGLRGANVCTGWKLLGNFLGEAVKFYGVCSHEVHLAMVTNLLGAAFHGSRACAGLLNRV